MGVDKALIPIGRKHLVLRVAERLAQACDPVFLAPGVPGRLGELGLPEVADEVSDAGPLGGLAAALAASPHPLLAAVAADMPFASPQVVRLLARLHAGQDAVVPRTAGGLEPLHALYSIRCLRAAREALRDHRFGLQALLERLDVRVVEESEWRGADPEGMFALNLNTAEDLSLLRSETEEAPGGAPSAAIGPSDQGR
jgi:molybdopterin-guanine dinucleotide biosynthesis protein A